MVEFAYFGQVRTGGGSPGEAGRGLSQEQLRASQEAADRALLAPTPTKVYTVPNIPNVPDMVIRESEVEPIVSTVSRTTTDAGRRQQLSPIAPPTRRQAPPRSGASTGQRVLTFFTDVTRSLIPGGSTGAGAPVTMPSTTMPSTQSWSPLTLQPAGAAAKGGGSSVMKYVLIGGGVLLAIGAAVTVAKLLKKKNNVEK